MPWKSGAEYAAKHNKKLKGPAAARAKNMAEAMMARGMDEGMSIATANKRAKGYGAKEKK